MWVTMKDVSVISRGMENCKTRPFGVEVNSSADF